MVKILAALALALSTMPALAQYSVIIQKPYLWKVVRIIDADTIEVEARWLPPELGQTIDIRLNGVDGPEKGGRAKCDRERSLSNQAVGTLSQILASGQPQIQLIGWDKFGGRVDGDIYVNGKSVTAILLERGLIKPYDGATKPDWCT
jgi:micrococcal nuclease